MAATIPTGTQLDGLLLALRDYAYGNVDEELEATADLSRSGAGLGPGWDIRMNSLAPLVVEATTKKTFATEAEAYRGAEELRDNLINSAEWVVKTYSWLGAFAVAKANAYDDIAAWFGGVRLRLWVSEG
jgi:hypothetical protein